MSVWTWHEMDIYGMIKVINLSLPVVVLQIVVKLHWNLNLNKLKPQMLTLWWSSEEIVSGIGPTSVQDDAN